MSVEFSPERQFDFWLGHWDVSWGEGEDEHGSNRVELLFDGKVVQENFDAPSLNFQGKSLSVYDARDEQWRQTWADNQGNYWTFSGRFQDGRMILSTEDRVDGQPVWLRMVFYNILAGSIDWDWERSLDGGENWELRWHIHYRRKQK
jgi:hypothetical protein